LKQHILIESLAQEVHIKVVEPSGEYSQDTLTLYMFYFSSCLNWF